MFENTLIESARRGKLEFVKLFIEEEKRDINAEEDGQVSGYNNRYNRRYYTALHVASQHGHLEVVRYLLEHGAKVNLALERNSADRTTPFVLAVKWGHAEIVEMLVKFGADINKRSDGKSLLSLAMRNNYDKVVACLLEHGADFRQQDFETRFVPLLSGIKPNSYELSANCLEATKVLLNFIENREGRAKMLEYLNGKGNVWGVTALHVACEAFKSIDCKAYELIELLLEYGADPTVEDDYGRRPYHSVYIKDAGMREKAVQLFRKYDSQLGSS